MPREINILLVDDDGDCRALSRDALVATCANARVREARSGADALAYLHGRGRFAGSPRPDLVYLDLQMPGLGGQEVLKRIKSDPDLNSIPVMIFTGLNDERERREAVESGALRYLLKPAEPVEYIRAVVASFLEWLHIERPAAGAVECDQRGH